MEMWKNVAIPEYWDRYLISNEGRVMSIKTMKLMTPIKSRFGYLRVKLAKDRHQKNIPIHRLVALTFIDNPENKPTVNHKNEIKTDNRVENLEWATIAEQNVWGTRIQRAVANTDWQARNKKTDYKEVARKHDYSRQDMCNRKRTSVYTIDGELIGTFNTQRDAAIATGVSRTRVSMCVKGIIRKVKGFVFIGEIEEFPIAVTKKRFGEE